MFAAAFGGDDDHTVGASCTVEGVGSGVLEHCHGCDVVGADGVEVAAVRSTVNDNQRVVSCVDGGDASDYECRRCLTRCAGCVGELYAGNASLDSVEGVGDLGLFDCF